MEDCGPPSLPRTYQSFTRFKPNAPKPRAFPWTGKTGKSSPPFGFGLLCDLFVQSLIGVVYCVPVELRAAFERRSAEARKVGEDRLDPVRDCLRVVRVDGKADNTVREWPSKPCPRVYSTGSPG